MKKDLTKIESAATAHWQKDATFKRHLTAFLAMQESPRTRRTYADILRDAFTYWGTTDINAIQVDLVARYKKSLSDDGYATATICQRMSCVRSFFSWLYDLQVIQFDPARFVKPPKIDSLVGKTREIAPAEVIALLAAPDKNILREFRDYLILELLFFTAIRNQELRSIRVGDLQVDGGYHVLAVRGKGNSRRRIPLQGFLVNDIESYKVRCGRDWSDKDSYLFTSLPPYKGSEENKLLSSMTLLDVVKKYSKRAGIKGRMSPHVGRVTVTNRLLDLNVSDNEIIHLTGWRSRSMVSRYERRAQELKKSGAHKVYY